MTPALALSSRTGDHIRAGMEFGPGAFAAFLTFLALLLLAMVFCLSAFVAALVNSAQHLHRAGKLRHPAAVVAVPIVALVVAFFIDSTVASPLLALAGVAFGYTIMWRSGQGWFRWTAIPLLCWTLTLVTR